MNRSRHLPPPEGEAVLESASAAERAAVPQTTKVNPDMSNPSDSFSQEPPAAMPGGTGDACGDAAAAKSVRASGCGGEIPAHSRRFDGKLMPPSVAGHGKSPAAQRGKSTASGSVAADGSGIAVKGYEQKEAMSCRKEEAAQHADTQRTKCHRERAPGGQDTARPIGESSPADSPGPTHRATSPARNEETPDRLSGRHGTATGAGAPPQGDPGAGSPTKQTPGYSGRDTQNSDIGSRGEAAQQPANEPPKQKVHSANWSAVNWSELEARVFRIQRAIHAAFKQGHQQRGHRLQSRLLRAC